MEMFVFLVKCNQFHVIYHWCNRNGVLYDRLVLVIIIVTKNTNSQGEIRATRELEPEMVGSILSTAIETGGQQVIIVS